MQWVATRATWAPTPCTSRRLSTVPRPGSTSTAIFARLTALTAASTNWTSVRSAESVVEGRSGQPVAVRHLDDLQAGVVQRAGDLDDVVLGELVPDGVAAVPQGAVGQPDRRLCRCRSSCSSLRRSLRVQISSPARTAAAVMMSRFPAHSGR